MTFPDFIASPLGAALVPAVIFAVLLFFLVRGMQKKLDSRLLESEKYRRRQYADLVERVEKSGERTSRDLLSTHQLLSGSARQNEERLEAMAQSLSRSVADIQRQMNELRASNEKRLDQMRDTVDRQLQTTLEKRLGESFKQVSEQLERVYKGLGEMQTLAGGVGDLKRVLTGVKTRGVWGEVRLGALMAENLTAEQYLTNTAVEPGGTERVEFAVRLPGKTREQPVLLPIDAKFPQEDYQRLLDAQEAGDKSAADAASARLEAALLEQAKRISGKYIRVPHTTDFAILFLPTEGLFAEALKRPGLAERLQQKYRVLPAGPTTLSALLCSLQTGFRTLAVEQRSEEIWRLLGSVREEFVRFGDALDKTRQRLTQAEAELDNASVRTRQLTRHLGRVQSLDVPEEWKQD